MDAYDLPKTWNYPTLAELLKPSKVVEQRLSAEELSKLRRNPLEGKLIAQNEPSKANSTNPRYTSVDEILIGLPFVPVNKDTFERERASGDVVLFFYNSSYDPGGYNNRIAQVFKEVLKDEHDDIKFLIYDKSKEPTIPTNFYSQNFGFSGEPYIAFYRHGQKIFQIDGGPKSDAFTRQWVPWLKKQIKTKFPDRQG